MRGRSNRTPKNEEAFLAVLRTGKSVTSACQAAGFAKRTAYDWRAADEDFRKAWDEAIEAGTDRLEEEAYRRACEGTDKPVYHQGQQVGTIREFSDVLTIFLLKGRRPEKFKDRSQVQHEGGINVTIQSSDADLL